MPLAVPPIPTPSQPPPPPVLPNPVVSESALHPSLCQEPQPIYPLLLCGAAPRPSLARPAAVGGCDQSVLNSRAMLGRCGIPCRPLPLPVCTSLPSPVTPHSVDPAISVMCKSPQPPLPLRLCRSCAEEPKPSLRRKFALFLSLPPQLESCPSHVAMRVPTGPNCVGPAALSGEWQDLISLAAIPRNSRPSQSAACRLGSLLGNAQPRASAGPCWPESADLWGAEPDGTVSAPARTDAAVKRR